MADINIQDIVRRLGEKELEIIQLRSELEKVAAELQKLQVPKATVTPIDGGKK